MDIDLRFDSGLLAALLRRTVSFSPSPGRSPTVQFPNLAAAVDGIDSLADLPLTQRTVSADLLGVFVDQSTVDTINAAEAVRVPSEITGQLESTEVFPKALRTGIRCRVFLWVRPNARTSGALWDIPITWSQIILLGRASARSILVEATNTFRVGNVSRLGIVETVNSRPVRELFQAALAWVPVEARTRDTNPLSAAASVALGRIGLLNVGFSEVAQTRRQSIVALRLQFERIATAQNGADVPADVDARATYSVVRRRTLESWREFTTAGPSFASATGAQSNLLWQMQIDGDYLADNIAAGLQQMFSVPRTVEAGGTILGPVQLLRPPAAVYRGEVASAPRDAAGIGPTSDAAIDLSTRIRAAGGVAWRTSGGPSGVSLCESLELDINGAVLLRADNTSEEAVRVQTRQRINATAELRPSVDFGSAFACVQAANLVPTLGGGVPFVAAFGPLGLLGLLGSWAVGAFSLAGLLKAVVEGAFSVPPVCALRSNSEECVLRLSPVPDRPRVLTGSVRFEDLRNIYIQPILSAFPEQQRAQLSQQLKIAQVHFDSVGAVISGAGAGTIVDTINNSTTPQARLSPPRVQTWRWGTRSECDPRTVARISAFITNTSRNFAAIAGNPMIAGSLYTQYLVGGFRPTIPPMRIDPSGRIVYSTPRWRTSSESTNSRLRLENGTVIAPNETLEVEIQLDWNAANSLLRQYAMGCTADTCPAAFEPTTVLIPTSGGVVRVVFPPIGGALEPNDAAVMLADPMCTVRPLFDDVASGMRLIGVGRGVGANIIRRTPDPQPGPWEINLVTLFSGGLMLESDYSATSVANFRRTSPDWTDEALEWLSENATSAPRVRGLPQIAVSRPGR